jgi:hypothetical protein
VLITVSDNPSVDQLAAAIGFTLLVNKLGKHSTAVFSGQVPSTIEFLEPEDTLEPNTDSLRDFIIALDKSKADKLRYKVEENVVKIFITPYRTSLTEADLDFSQGDYNVDVVVALGVNQQEHIDKAIEAHGRILHDATIIGVMAGQTNIDIGGINWQDPSASSLCEMLVSISEAFQSGLMDSQMATAFLTGIVSETNRFSNEKTTPKVMTMAAQLMAAGANQQLIATKLEIAEQPPQPEPPAEMPSDQPQPDEGTIELHENQGVELPPPPPAEHNHRSVEQIDIDKHGTLRRSEEPGLQQPEPPKENIVPPAEDAPLERPYSSFVTEPPMMGGTLTANARPEDLEPSTDPLSAIPQADIVGLPESEASTQSPLLSVQDDAESVLPEEVSSTDSPFLQHDGEYDVEKHLGPDIKNDDTLENIEATVEKYENSDQQERQQQDADAARRAVFEAVDNAYDPNRPDPIESLNAQPMIDEEQLNGSPPIMPPPIVPPFPLPPEADGPDH